MGPELRYKGRQKISVFLILFGDQSPLSSLYKPPISFGCLAFQMPDTQLNDCYSEVPFHIPDNMTLARFILDYRHGIRPERQTIPCLIDNDSGRVLGINELKQRTEQLYMGLVQAFCLDGNDVVMLLSPNHIDYSVAIWATHFLGGIVTCSNPQLRVDELVHQLSTVKVRLMVVHSNTLETALSAARIVGLPSDRIVLIDEPQCEPTAAGPSSDRWSIPRLVDLGERAIRSYSDGFVPPCGTVEGSSKVAMLCWSSGTTGPPKAVAISHKALIANIIQMAVHNGVQHLERCSKVRTKRSYAPGDIALAVLPFYHVAGLVISLHLAIFSSMTVVVMTKWSLADMLKSISCYNISHLYLVPPQALALSKHPLVESRSFLSQVRYIMIGAAPVPPSVQETLFRLFPDAQIGQAYGLTEMTTTVAMIAADQKHGPLGSGGRLLPGITVQVLKPDGTLADSGEKGELVVKGPACAMGYFNDPVSTKETFTNGWVKTGDEAVVTEDKEVYILDRIKEMIKVKGLQVAPAEIEGCLLTHPDVEDACVVSVLDDVGRELPTAFVVLSPSSAHYLQRNGSSLTKCKQDIIDFVKEQKAPYKRLSGGVLFTETIPRNPSGKILRRILRERARHEVGVVATPRL
ncbi:hypothetical protein BJ165DRAFT_1193944 [Panaeolus papilionaceus]|nr:hypothetical protein BJ165DRAFT_1193944 [Panaeolus papilionaceus]